MDKPIWVRYTIWLSDVSRLNLGRSQWTNRPVTTLLAEAFPNTLQLALATWLVCQLAGFTMGILAALKQDSPTDAFITAFNSLGLATPSFWLGLLMILLFAVKLKWLPPSGTRDPYNQDFLHNLRYLIMPVISLSFSGTAALSRFVRSALIDVMSAEYVRTARAKGLSERVVIARHALKNALLPIVTVMGMQFGALLGGAVVTESVFAYSGIGRLVVSSIMNRDYPVVQGVLMLVVLIFLLVNLVVDLIYGYVDPRVRLRMAA